MTCNCKGRIIDQIKVIGKIENVAARNGVNYTDGFLEFGGPLIHDTEITGSYKLKFGTPSSRPTEIHLRASAALYLEIDTGTAYSTLGFTNAGLAVINSPSSRGIFSDRDYSANYTPFTYVQKVYTDTRIVGFPASTDVYTPGPPQNGKVIAWNEPARMWVMQAAGAAPTAGADTQVIHNIGGVLVGHENFTFTTATNFLSVPSISLGHSVLGGQNRFISALGSEANINIILQPKAVGNIELSAFSGNIVIGAPSSPNLVHRIMVRGAAAQVDLALEPKGTDGMVFIGDKDEAGSFRRLGARGYNAHVNLMLMSKGHGDIILEADPGADGDGGWVKIGSGSSFAAGIRTRRIYAASDYVTTNLEIGGDGSGFTLFIGTPNQNVSNRFLTVSSAALDCNLNIYGKGAGLVAINGFVRSKKIALVNWNMNSGTAYNIPHGLPDHTKIISVEIVVRNDIGSEYGPLDRITSTDINNGGILNWDATYIYTRLTTSSHFKSSLYDLTGGYVRGWAYINYEL